MAQFHKSADVVIIGQGGIVGASVAHHLIERGWDNIIGIDKSGIPTDIGSTGHASDFCFNTMHDQITIFTTRYSIDFFEKRGRYARIGGIEVARKGDDERMRELERRVSSGRAFGNRVEMITAQRVKELMPLIEEDVIQGGLWDPDAGLVIPRSQVVAGELIRDAEESGKLQTLANTPCTGLDIENGRIKGVHTTRGTIETNHVVVCAGLWGRLIAAMAGEDLPVMPVDHPLTFFGPHTAFEGTGKEIGYPLLRDQGNSAYLRDTGDPKTTEGGQIEWGYYEENAPRLVHPRDLLEKEEARLSPSQRDLEMEQVMDPLERAMELTPILGELGYNEKHSFNGLLQVTADGGPSIGESPDVRGLWYGVSVWVKDGPGTGKLIADWMTAPNSTTMASTTPATIRSRRPSPSSTTAVSRRRSKSTIRRSTTASPTPRAGTCAAAPFTCGRRNWAATSWRSPAGNGRTAMRPTRRRCWPSTPSACPNARTSGTPGTSGGCPTPSTWSSRRTSAW